jgi:hypothetical protein
MSLSQQKSNVTMHVHNYRDKYAYDVSWGGGITVEHDEGVPQVRGCGGTVHG